MAPKAPISYSDSFTHDVPYRTTEKAHNNGTLTHHVTDPQDELKDWDAAVPIPRVRTGATLLNQPVVKTLVFRKKVFNSDISIWHCTESSETLVYFAACSEWKRNVPDITLHSAIAGQDSPGPILGVAHFRYARNVKFGIGDAQKDPNSVQWEEMRNVSKMLTKSKYEWDFTEYPEWSDIDAGTHPPGTRRFRWQRTISNEDGVENKLSLRNYRLTDEESGSVVAVFVASTFRNLRKRGELRLFEKLRPKVEVAVVLTCTSIAEKLNRD
ncbi:hypothetical protein A1O7_05141 [Cladophialophora yegresii CBS 114405]|uniref:Uncharacterized protein n=1 Tax=Cladophialophora yegresii CBS 114405 TaxID=1182544 RepID=W9VZ95_9EURO|nr:uncharacterized protein A1O7_05141 [Cladophialophora yegresii CBS 114405]EXJ60988.1 hypothetical protein A1O7_05141 [Cladophialophora yegresii CBS 114405]